MPPGWIPAVGFASGGLEASCPQRRGALWSRWEQSWGERTQSQNRIVLVVVKGCHVQNEECLLLWAGLGASSTLTFRNPRFW